MCDVVQTEAPGLGGRWRPANGTWPCVLGQRTPFPANGKGMWPLEASEAVPRVNAAGGLQPRAVRGERRMETDHLLLHASFKSALVQGQAAHPVRLPAAALQSR
eukprot:6054515-Prymnesium_polylepis.1